MIKTLLVLSVMVIAFLFVLMVGIPMAAVLFNASSSMWAVVGAAGILAQIVALLAIIFSGFNIITNEINKGN
jgi:hypothetical protein